MRSDLQRRLFAEVLGTALLLAIVIGSGIMAERLSGGNIAIALLANTLATVGGLYILIEVLGPVSGAHFNPAVSIGLFVGGRFPAGQLLPYIVSQVLGGLAAGGVLYLIASGKAGFDLAGGFASNGFGEHSPGKFNMQAALIAEVVLTAFFLIIILGATDKRAPAGIPPIAIGLAQTLIHLISIPVTNTSVNPARSTAVAMYVGGWAVEQLWLFWVAPIVGAVLGATVYKLVGSDSNKR